MARSWFPAALGSVAIAAGVVIGVAGAINVSSIPNPGFEQASPPPCTPLPLTLICGWNDLVGTLTQDANHHTGSFSMKLTNAGPSVEATTAGGVCVTPISPGAHSASFWYFTSSPVVDVRLGAHWYPNTTCTVATFGDSDLSASTPLTYGAWTQVVGTLTAPAGTGSAFFSVFASCQCTQGPVTAFFDDVGFDIPTAVTLVSLTAARSTPGVLVRWRTGTEADTLGFHIYRERAGKRVRVDRRLIPSKGSVSGARYSFVDRRAPRGKLTYQLQAVGTDGSRTWYGRASVVR
jgi:hypothetical protein